MKDPRWKIFREAFSELRICKRELVVDALHDMLRASLDDLRKRSQGYGSDELSEFELGELSGQLSAGGDGVHLLAVEDRVHESLRSLALLYDECQIREPYPRCDCNECRADDQ